MLYHETLTEFLLVLEITFCGQQRNCHQTNISVIIKEKHHYKMT